MNKLVRLGLAAAVVSTSLMANNTKSWYAGLETGTGSGERTFEAYSVDMDTTTKAIKVGTISKKFDRIEFEVIQKDLQNKKYSSDKDSVTEYKFNSSVSIYSLAYKHYVVPYFEAGIGWGVSDAADGQFATHLGLGIISEPYQNILVNVGYRLSTNIGSRDEADYADQHGDTIVGVAYKF